MKLPTLVATVAALAGCNQPPSNSGAEERNASKTANIESASNYRSARKACTSPEVHEWRSCVLREAEESSKAVKAQFQLTRSLVVESAELRARSLGITDEEEFAAQFSGEFASAQDAWEKYAASECNSETVVSAESTASAFDDAMCSIELNMQRSDVLTGFENAIRSAITRDVAKLKDSPPK